MSARRDICEATPTECPVAAPWHITHLYDIVESHLENEHGMGPVSLRSGRPMPGVAATSLTVTEAVRQDREDTRKAWDFWLGALVKVAILAEAVIVAVWLIAKHGG